MKTKKDLKNDYKQLKPRMGVFQIRNLTNNKILVEGGVNYTALWNRYRMQLNWGKHPNTALQNDWQEFGEDNFVFEVLSEIEWDETKTINYAKEVKILTQLYVEELLPFGDKGYNKE